MNVASPAPSAFELQPRDPRLAEWLSHYPPEIFGDRLYQSIELMERYSIALAGNLLEELGILDRLEDWQSADQLCGVLSFQPRFVSALSWLLERVVESEYIDVRRDGEADLYRSRQRLPAAELPRLRELATQIDAGNVATLDLLDHAAAIYPAVARGEQTGEQKMFGPQGIALWLNYFHNDNLTYAVNNWVGAVLAADRLCSRSKLRILEVGAGAGSATGTLLNWFDQRGLLPRIERYLVTEPNAFFRRRAQRELMTRYPNVPLEWSTLDLDQAWSAQVAGAGDFDLIYAVNVLHVSKDLGFSLAQAAATLAEGGWLVIGECVRPYEKQPIYPELMFQNLASFIDVTTDLEVRPRPGFLTPEQWRRAFAHCGLDHIEVAPDIEKIRDIYSHFFTAAICGQKTAAANDSTGAGS